MHIKLANKCDKFEYLHRQFSREFAYAKDDWYRFISRFPYAGSTPKEWSAYIKENIWISAEAPLSDLKSTYTNVISFLPLTIECKITPKTHRTKIEALYRLTQSTRSFNVVLFFCIHFDALQALADANTWTDVGDSEDAKVGSFTLANQTKADPKAIVKTLELAEKLIRQSDIPNVKSILYGSVIIATKLVGEANVMAFYNYQQDTIYIQALKSYSHVVEKTLLHEIGHRYYRKFAKTESKREWDKHHDDVGKSGRKLEEGDIIYLSEGTYEFYKTDFYKSGKKVRMLASLRDPVSKKHISNIDYEVATRSISYPTAYSRTSAEEHFCEAFSMYLLGILQPEHFAAFERIWANP
jgi:hypothetical protein